MKKVIFWVLYLPLGLSMIAANILEGICHEYDELLHKYERWSFDDPDVI